MFTLSVLCTALLAGGDAAAATTIDFNDVPDRIWVGREWWVNRPQDWRVRDGRLECTEQSANLPQRTAHRLTSALRDDGRATIRVRLGRLDESSPAQADSWAGLLIGAGDETIDYRLTAQVHHAPAEDGGLLIVLTDTGRLSVRRNDEPLENTPLWSINARLGAEAFPEIAGVDIPTGRAFTTLEVQLAPGPNADRVNLTARALNEQDETTAEIVTMIDAAHAGGCLALVSTGGPSGNGSGHWFDDLSWEGDRIATIPERAVGPILGALYTRDDRMIRMTAQLVPLAVETAPPVTLHIRAGERSWLEVGQSAIRPDSWTATFEYEFPLLDADHEYELRWNEPLADGGTKPASHRGVIRATPDLSDRAYRIGLLNCHKTYTGGLRWNSNGLWFPHDDLVRLVDHHDPDFLFFAGDQIYEGDLTPADRRGIEQSLLDYHYKWSKWYWAFGPLVRERPCVAIPDDHDVYHGNIWGAGGRRARGGNSLSAQDSGGYVMPPRFVNAVHATQVSHLPASRIEPVIGDGYTTYTTSFVDAGVSFAVIADRMFKESPSIAVPEGNFRNGWPQNLAFDPAEDADPPGVPLLGEIQEMFLRAWAVDYSRDAWMKVVLSQTPFAAVHTLPASEKDDSVVGRLPLVEPGAYPPDDRPVPDADTNGWPPSGRDRAVEALRRGFAIHLAGDQHLATVVQYGLSDFGDAGWCFTGPAIANTWPRRWLPEGNATDPTDQRYKGDFLDGFGNRITMHATANPQETGIEPTALHDRVPGYGLVHLDPRTRAITFEAWKRSARPGEPTETGCYDDWPITLQQTDAAGQSWGFSLPVPDLGDRAARFVLRIERVIADGIDSMPPLYAIRLGPEWRPRVPDVGPWRMTLVNTATGETIVREATPGFPIEEDERRWRAVE